MIGIIIRRLLVDPVLCQGKLVQRLPKHLTQRVKAEILDGSPSGLVSGLTQARDNNWRQD
jgi:hypothetical protein